MPPQGTSAPLSVEASLNVPLAPHWANKPLRFLGTVAVGIVSGAGVVLTALTGFTPVIPGKYHAQVATTVGIATAVSAGALKFLAWLGEQHVYSPATHAAIVRTALNTPVPGQATPLSAAPLTAVLSSVAPPSEAVTLPDATSFAAAGGHVDPAHHDQPTTPVEPPAPVSGPGAPTAPEPVATAPPPTDPNPAHQPTDEVPPGEAPGQ